MTAPQAQARAFWNHGAAMASAEIPSDPTRAPRKT